MPFGALSLLTADPEACVAIFAHWRWPTGFICPHCQSQRATRIKNRPSWRCLNCERQTRLTANTALHGSHLPLQDWIYAIFTVAQRKSSISAAQLQRELVISYTSAWFMLQRIRRFLAERSFTRLQRGVVEVASARLHAIDARPHPHTEDTCPTSDIDTVVVAIERVGRGDEQPQLRFGRLRALAIPPGMPASTLVGLHVLADAEISHVKKPITRTILKNFTDALRGTCHGVSRKHLPAYLQEHVFRFNRRRRPDLLPSFIGRRLACGQRLKRSLLRTTPPGVDLLVRTEETADASAALEADLPAATTTSDTKEKPTRRLHPATPPPTVEPFPATPREPQTPEELETAQLDKMLAAVGRPRRPNEDARMAAKRILAES